MFEQRPDATKDRVVKTVAFIIGALIILGVCWFGCASVGGVS